jgi:hypothetical protein
MGHKKRTYEVAPAREAHPAKEELRLFHKGEMLGKDTRIVFNKNKDDMRKVDHYRVRFQLKDFSDSKLKFVTHNRDAFWVREGEEEDCPTSPCEMPGEIWLDEVDKKGEWIDVINMDLKEVRFQFTLNFVDKSIANPTPADYIPLDPGGGNEDMGGGGSDLTFNTELAVGAATGAIVGIGAALSINASANLGAPGALIYGIGGAVVGLIVAFLIDRI